MNHQHIDKKQALLKLVLVLAVFSSCHTSKLAGRNKLFQYTRNPAGMATGKIYSTDETVRVRKVEEVEGKLKITVKKGVTFEEEKSFPLTNEAVTGRGIGDDNATVYYYLDEDNDDVTATRTGKKKLRKNFAYLTQGLGIQSLSVPLKFRNRQGINNAIPPGVESSFNLGLALGWKNSLNIFQTKANFLSKRTTQYSLTPGFGFNFGTVDLDPATNAPGIGSKRKSAIFSYGGFLLFGLNNINFGYSVGFDKALGAGGSNWTYHDVLWQGLVVSLDIIKF